MTSGHGEGVRAVVEHLRAGELQQALALALAQPLEELHQKVLGEAFDHQSLVCYGLYVGMLAAGESAERHVAASELLALALNIFPGAYQTAVFHARRAIALAPDDASYKEHLLSFHNNPEELLPDDEARRVAEELLALDSSNDAAREVLQAAGDKPRLA